MSMLHLNEQWTQILEWFWFVIFLGVATSTAVWPWSTIKVKKIKTFCQSVFRWERSRKFHPTQPRRSNMVENKITKVTTVLKSYYFRYMSIVPILNMLGSVGAYPMGEWLGRKKVLFLFFISINVQCSCICRSSFSRLFSISWVLWSSTLGEA